MVHFINPSGPILIEFSDGSEMEVGTNGIVKVRFQKEDDWTQVDPYRNIELLLPCMRGPAFPSKYGDHDG